MMNLNAAPVFKAWLFKMLGCCIFFMPIFSASAQVQTRGKVEVVKDSRIDTLIARRMEIARTGGSGSSGAVYSSSGYRVQIFSGSNRAAAYSAMAKMQQIHPGLRTYISYRDPNFKVHAGDFRTRLEASKLMQEIRIYFPILFIIPQKINPPKLESQ